MMDPYLWEAARVYLVLLHDFGIAYLAFGIVMMFALVGLVWHNKITR